MFIFFYSQEGNLYINLKKETSQFLFKEKLKLQIKILNAVILMFLLGWWVEGVPNFTHLICACSYITNSSSKWITYKLNIF